MTKQKELREGLYDLIKKDFIGYWLLKIPTRWLVNKILSYLHSQGVVVKVDRELPMRPYGHSFAIRDIYMKAQQDMLRAGYVAVEPLIGGNNGL